jgi:hypothetical protein
VGTVSGPLRDPQGGSGKGSEGSAGPRDRRQAVAHDFDAVAPGDRERRFLEIDLLLHTGALRVLGFAAGFFATGFDADDTRGGVSAIE